MARDVTTKIQCTLSDKAKIITSIIFIFKKTAEINLPYSFNNRLMTKFSQFHSVFENSSRTN